MPPTLEKALTLHLFLSKEDTLSLNSTKGDAQRLIAALNQRPSQEHRLHSRSHPRRLRLASPRLNTNTLYLDARMHFREPKTGDVFYVHSPGPARLDPAIEKVLAWDPDAKTTEGKDRYAFVHPAIEVSGERHKWRERTAFVRHEHYYVPGDGTQAVDEWLSEEECHVLYCSLPDFTKLPRLVVE